MRKWFTLKTRNCLDILFCYIASMLSIHSIDDISINIIIIIDNIDAVIDVISCTLTCGNIDMTSVFILLLNLNIQ